MKLSSLSRIHDLQENRREIGAFIQKCRDNPSELVRIGAPWRPIFLSLRPEDVEALRWQAEAALQSIEAEMKQLGVEVDVPTDFDEFEDAVEEVEELAA